MKLTVFNKTSKVEKFKSPANLVFNIFDFIRISVIVLEKGTYEDELYKIYHRNNLEIF